MRATFSSVALFIPIEALPPSAVHLQQNVRYRAINVRLTAERLAGNWRDVRDSDNRGNAEREKRRKEDVSKMFHVKQ